MRRYGYILSRKSDEVPLVYRRSGWNLENIKLVPPTITVGQMEQSTSSKGAVTSKEQRSTTVRKAYYMESAAIVDEVPLLQHYYFPQE